MKRKVGARALRSIIEDIMMDYMFDMPGGNKKTLSISKKTVTDYIDETLTADLREAIYDTKNNQSNKSSQAKKGRSRKITKK